MWRWSVLLLVVSCSAPKLGRPFQAAPLETIKVGYDRRTDVLRKMGDPYRRTIDSQGRELFVYLWADGEGQGQKCVVAFNENDVVYVVEVAP